MQEGGRPFDSIVPKSRYLLVIAVATFVVGLLEATDVIEIPFGVWFSELTGSLLPTARLNAFMTSYGYASLFALMAMESASLPIPSEVVLPFAGYLVYLGTLNFWAAVVVSTLAGLAGALVDYCVAVWLGRPFVIELLKLFRLHRGTLDRAAGWFARSGQWTVFAARFVPGLRTVISLPAGLFRMRIWIFVVMTVAGCLTWSIVLVYAGLLAGSSSGALSAFTNSPTVMDDLSALVAIISAAYIGYYFYSAFRRKTRVSLPSSEPSRPSSWPS